MIEILAKTNDFNYNLLKTAEECTELAEILLKRVNKEGTMKCPSDDEIIEEIGDVKLRLSVLSRLFDKNKIKARVDFKLGRYEKWHEEGKYAGRI